MRPSRPESTASAEESHGSLLFNGARKPVRIPGVSRGLGREICHGRRAQLGGEPEDVPALAPRPCTMIIAAFADATGAPRRGPAVRRAGRDRPFALTSPAPFTYRRGDGERRKVALDALAVFLQPRRKPQA